MKSKIKERLQRTLKLCAIALIIGALIGLVQSRERDMRWALGGDFSLTNHNGKIVTQEEYKESYMLIFFGFTACPMVCPTALAKITNVMELLGEDSARVQPLFITIDPQYDTPEVMRDYLEQFHSRIIGLTGTLEEIEEIKSTYKVFAQKAAASKGDDYQIDHSSLIYLMRPGGDLIALYRAQDSAEKIAAEIVKNFPRSLEDHFPM